MIELPKVNMVKFKFINRRNNMKRIFIITLFIIILSNLGFAVLEKTPTSESAAMFILEQEIKYEKERADYVQSNILYKILGSGKATITVDVELGLVSEKLESKAAESAATRKRKIGEIEYILPGIPSPKGVSQGTPPGECSGRSTSVRHRSNGERTTESFCPSCGGRAQGNGLSSGAFRPTAV